MDKKLIKNRVKEIEDSINVEMREAKDKVTKAKIKKNGYKKFDEIYELYGSEAYRKFVPRKIRKQDVKQLLREKSYISVYNKHGEKTIRAHIGEIKGSDIEYESGSKFKKMIYKTKRFLKIGAFTSAAMMTAALPAAIFDYSEQHKKSEMEDYGEQVIEYLDDVEKYGQNIKEQEFTDLQNVMYIMDDMWSGILGYKTPKHDLTVCPGLDLANTDGYGVCRNMADDCARKLNAINPDYNARVIQVYAAGSNYKIAGIDIREYHPEGEAVEQHEDPTILDEIAVRAAGNHAVTIFHSLEDDVELIADPTNPGIGIFSNGKIHMFNAKGENPIEFKYRPLSAILYGKESVAEIPQNYADGIGYCSDEKMADLEGKYGIDQQNEALKYTRSVKPVSFYDTIKIEPEAIQNKKERNEETHAKENQNSEQDFENKNSTEKQENNEVFR